MAQRTTAHGSTAYRREVLEPQGIKIINQSTTAHDSAAYRRDVLEPRGIKIINQSDPNRAKPLMPFQFARAAALDGAFLTFDSAKLVKASQFAMGKYNKAQWNAEIYQWYFLLTNLVFDQSRVQRMVQHSFCWSGSSANVCLAPVQHFDRRASGSHEYPKVSFVANERPQDISCWPDHCYFAIPESNSQLRNYTKLPAFRGGLSYDSRGFSCPPYFVTEEKPSADLEVEARDYLAFITGFLLQERLLLRHLTDKAQFKSEIAFDESLCVYAMTNCGHLSTIYKMVVRNEFANAGPLTARKPVRFDFVKLRDFFLTDKADCDELRLWINYIHYWGVKVHMRAVMAEGAEAWQSKYYVKSAWEESCARKAFYYRETGIAFTTLKYDYLGRDEVS